MQKKRLIILNYKMKCKIVLFLLALIIFSCEDIIEVPDISQKVVVVLAPTEDVVINETNINFSWNIVEDADTYKLQIATPNFEAATQIVLDTTITNTNFTKMLDVGSYQWRIRAENSDYQTNYTTQSFTVE